MNRDSSDDGLVHGHDWCSNSTMERGDHPMVADASEVNTPSSVFNDDAMYGE